MRGGVWNASKEGAIRIFNMMHISGACAWLYEMGRKWRVEGWVERNGVLRILKRFGTRRFCAQMLLNQSVVGIFGIQVYSCTTADAVWSSLNYIYDARLSEEIIIQELL